ncbi:hypothetical protein KCV87_05360 [Actinosynnema pretiosum subsp. pretiosum]|uniref:Uncharacterized protein n=2 Tax=Actinosynnema TaxID=40566 RepID=C6WQJ4_ACTMD|nr:hypothetical protein [Actinosynnema mirum]ACU36848.1 hypothetical protein Amir_2927 [Actinosynnema mirum DSM 43827]QUF05527.1 hypothetical protein KCV87_05360 [Actinosynnema pretiosum subsp. pretiosum]
MSADGGVGGGAEVGDLAEELRATRVEQVEHLRRGDPETARLMGAWINALLDEWNRRRGCRVAPVALLAVGEPGEGDGERHGRCGG